MINWRMLNVGDKVMWNVDDFDGKCKIEGIVNEVASDHVIVNAEGNSLWLDDWNSGEFFPISGEYKINGTSYTYDPVTNDVHFYCDRFGGKINLVCMNDCERNCERYYCCQYIADADDAIKTIECE